MHPTHERRARMALAALGAVATLCLTIPTPRHAAPAEAAPKTPSLTAGVGRSIAEREYEATDSGSGLQAPNRAHGLRAWFDASGARVVDREDGAAVLARLRTAAVGGEAVGAGEVRAAGSRVEVRRDGLVEWFENSERGLEHGWTLDARPERGGPLTIDVDLGAGGVSVANDRAVIEAPGERRLEYGGLASWDADGRALASRMEAVGGGLVRLVVDDAGARYPVTVDPGLRSPAFATITPVQTDGLFGFSVAGAGDVNGDGYDDVVVGASGYDSGDSDEGAAFVFLGGPSGVSSGTTGNASAVLQADQFDARMGTSVAGAGDVNGDGYDDVIVGAPRYDLTTIEAGAAFVFLGGPAGIASGTPTTAAGVIEGDEGFSSLGSAVASAGDVDGDGYDDVIVGAPAEGAADEGAAFVFLGGPAGIAGGTPADASAVLLGEQIQSSWGESVAGAGDVNGDGYDDVVLGASRYDMTIVDEGAAFVFLGSLAGVSNGGAATASAVLRGNETLSDFGVSVAGAGDVDGDGFDDVVVAAPRYDASLTNEGAAFVFSGGPAGIPSGPPSVASAVLRSDQADSSLNQVAGAGDVNADGYDDVAVGAIAFDSGQSDEGVVLLFVGGPAGVVGTTPATAAAALEIDRAFVLFGRVARAGDVDGDGFDDLIVGVPGGPGGGAAYVFRGASDGVNGFPPPRTSLLGGQTGAQFGLSVAGAGDVNADGFDDVIVGAPGYDMGLADEGAAFVFLGGPEGVTTASASAASAVLWGGQGGANLGNTVAGVGDINADGYDDVAAGAPSYDFFAADVGLLFVFLGGPDGIESGPAPSAATVFSGERPGDAFPLSLAGAGDVNADGYDDVVVGAPFYDSEVNGGAAFLLLGGPDGIPSGTASTASATLVGGQPGASFGFGVGGAGDVDADGYDDVVVGAPGLDGATPGVGAACVFLGGPSGIASGGPSTAAAVLTGVQLNGEVGRGVAGAGDVNADGYSDVVVGAPGVVSAGARGAVYAFLGGPNGIPSATVASADTVLTGANLDMTNFGLRVAGAGDVNADGYSDVVVGAAFYDGDGAAFVFLGGSGGVDDGTPANAAVTARVPGSRGVGNSVAGAGDVDNDGFDDFVVGAPSTTVSFQTEGAAYVYSRPRVTNDKDTPGVYVPSTATFFLRNSNTGGRADVAFSYGAGNAGYVPITGDWDANGVDTPGLYEPSTGTFFLANENVPGPADLTFGFGAGGAGLVPLSGDWDGDGVDTVGLYDPAAGVFFLRDANAPGAADVVFAFGAGGGAFAPIVGDWNGDGTDTVGLYAPATGAFFLRNLNAPGPADMAFTYGSATGWTPLAGDFDGDGTDTVGLYNPATGTFFLRNANAGGPADVTFGFGPAGVAPLVGDWNGK